MFNIGTHSSCKLRMKEEDSELSDDLAENTQVRCCWQLRTIALTIQTGLLTKSVCRLSADDSPLTGRQQSLLFLRCFHFKLCSHLLKSLLGKDFKAFHQVCQLAFIL